MRQRSRMSVCLCLSSLALRPSASTCSSLLNYGKKRPSEGSKRRRHQGTMRERSTTQSARRTEGLLGSGMHARDTERQDRGHGIFDVHVRGKREPGRLRKYRPKRVDTH